MPTLTHFSFCPHSRAVRLALAEAAIVPLLAEQRPWDWSQALLALNPAGELPVLEMDDGVVLCGSYAISEYLAALPEPDDAREDGRRPRSMPLFPGSPLEQAEVRRLVDWFHGKLHREVTVPLLESHVVPMFKGTAQAPPDTDVLRAARANLAYHMSYVTWLSDQRNWLAGNEPSFADMAAAAHLSCLDYLGEVDWRSFAAAKTWYQRLKSRRSFQALLADHVPGRAPPAHYSELDF